MRDTETELRQFPKLNLPLFRGEEGEWETWKMQLETLLGLFGLLSDIKGETPKSMSEQDRTRQNRVYGLIVLNTRGNAARLLTGVEAGNGREAYARLCQRYEPQRSTRWMRLMKAIIEPDLSGEGGAKGPTAQKLETTLEEQKRASLERLRVFEYDCGKCT